MAGALLEPATTQRVLPAKVFWQLFQVFIVRARSFTSSIISVGLVSASCARSGSSASGLERALTEERITLRARVEQLDTLVREPMIAEHRSGALFVTGYNRRAPALWRSSDGGTTWKRVDVGGEAEGATGNSDVDLAVATDGTVYFVSMTYDRHREPPIGTQISIGVSEDEGASWRWRILSHALGDDRPWVAVAPNGTAHVIWNNGHGVNHAISRDRGRSWMRTGRVTDRGGSSHLAIGLNGEIAVRVGPGSESGNRCDKGVDLVVVSEDEGATWHRYAAPGSPRPSGCVADSSSSILRWVDPVAWDSTGALYTLWTTGAGVWLARSENKGATWTTARVATDAPDTAFFPYLTARAPGILAATWLTFARDSLHWRVARIDMRDGAEHPRIAASAALPLESWSGDPIHADAGGEYLPVALLANGSVAVVTPIQHESAHRLGFTWWRFTVH